jgi:hypothetical protein
MTCVRTDVDPRQRGWDDTVVSPNGCDGCVRGAALLSRRIHMRMQDSPRGGHAGTSQLTRPAADEMRADGRHCGPIGGRCCASASAAPREVGRAYMAIEKCSLMHGAGEKNIMSSLFCGARTKPHAHGTGYHGAQLHVFMDIQVWWRSQGAAASGSGGRRGTDSKANWHKWLAGGTCARSRDSQHA